MLSLFKIMLSAVIVVAATADDHIYKLRAIGNLTNTNWKDVINSVTYNSDGTILAVNGDKSLGVYTKGSLSNFLIKRNISNSYKSYYSVFSMDSTELVSVGSSLSISIYLKEPRVTHYSLAQSIQINSASPASYVKAAITEDSRRIIALSDNGLVTVLLRQADNSFALEDSFSSGSPTGRTMVVRFGGKLVTSGSDNKIKVWQFSYTTNRYALLQQLPTESEVQDLDMVRDEKLLVAGLASGNIRVWKQTDNMFSKVQEIELCRSEVTRVRFIQRNYLLANCPATDELSILQYDSEEEEFQLMSSTSADSLQLMSVDNSGKNVVACQARLLRCKIYAVQIDCAKQLHSVGNNSDDDDETCKCADSFYWNIATQRCQLDCGAIEHSTRKPSINDQTCQCVENYAWQSIGWKCVESIQHKLLIRTVIITVGIVFTIVFVSCYFLRKCRKVTSFKQNRREESSIQQYGSDTFQKISSNSSI